MLTIQQTREGNITHALESIPKRLYRDSKFKWFRLLGVLLSAVPYIAGESRMFSRLHCALRTVEGWIIILTAPVNNDLARQVSLDLSLG